jgi:hypothetical protein
VLLKCDRVADQRCVGKQIKQGQHKVNVTSGTLGRCGREARRGRTVMMVFRKRSSEIKMDSRRELFVRWEFGRFESEAMQLEHQIRGLIESFEHKNPTVRKQANAN